MTTREERLRIASLISGGKERAALPVPADKPALQLPDTPYYIIRASKELRKKFPGSMLVRDMARRLQTDLREYITATDLFEWFRKEGYILSSYGEFNRPATEIMEKGWMVCAKCGMAGNGVRYCTPYITPAGYIEFLSIIRKKGGLK